MTIDSKKIISRNIQHLMDINSKSRKDVCSALGLNYATFSDWLQGRSYPRTDKLEKLAAYFGCTPSDLMNDNLPNARTNRQHEKRIETKQSTDTTLPPGAIPINSSNSVLIPVLGTIAAGIPIYAEDNIIGYEDIPIEWTNGGREYFALRVKGASMEPKICEGDTIIIKKQNYIDNGEIAVVLINGDEATVKQVKKTNEGLLLIGFNTAVYSPTLYPPDEVINLPVEIIGKVVEMRRKM